MVEIGSLDVEMALDDIITKKNIGTRGRGRGRGLYSRGRGSFQSRSDLGSLRGVNRNSEMALDDIIKKKNIRGRGLGLNFRGQSGFQSRGSNYSGQRGGAVGRGHSVNRGSGFRGSSRGTQMGSHASYSNFFSVHGVDARPVQRPVQRFVQRPIQNPVADLMQTEEPTKITISNLDIGVSDNDISELFSDFGKINSSAIHYDRNGTSLSTAHVIYERRQDAVKAFKHYNEVMLDGCPMTIVIEGGENVQSQTSMPRPLASVTAARVSGFPVQGGSFNGHSGGSTRESFRPIGGVKQMRGGISSNLRIGVQNNTRTGFRGSTRGAIQGYNRGGFQGSNRGGFQGSNRGGFQGNNRGRFQGSNRGGFRGNTRGAGRGQGGFVAKTKNLTAEELDKELDAYASNH